VKLLFSEDEINKKTKKLAEILDSQYKDKNVTMIYIEKGGKQFFDKLIKNLNINPIKDSIRVKSYAGTQSGELTWLKKPSVDINGSACLLIDDILDTGQTIKKVKDFMLKSGAKECKICVAVNKHERRIENIEPDYYLFDLDKGFIVGFGMDYNEDYRELPAIYTMDD
jgi:hypoxanthine phosphoribosyltransferase